MALPRKEEKTYSWTLQHNSPPKHNDDPSSEHIFGLQIEKELQNLNVILTFCCKLYLNKGL